MAMGPVQMLVLGFSELEFTGKIAAELDKLREHDFVRIVDALVVNKDDEGNITALQVSDLTTDEAMEMGAIAGALVGLGEGVMIGIGYAIAGVPSPIIWGAVTGVLAIVTSGCTPSNQSAVAAVSQVFTGAVMVKCFFTPCPQMIHGIVMSSVVPWLWPFPCPP